MERLRITGASPRRPRTWHMRRGRESPYPPMEALYPFLQAEFLGFGLSPGSPRHSVRRLNFTDFSGLDMGSSARLPIYRVPDYLRQVPAWISSHGAQLTGASQCLASDLTSAFAADR
jgi:hypothetical protein